MNKRQLHAAKKSVGISNLLAGAVLLFALTLSACQSPRAERTDPEFERLRKSFPGITDRCLNMVRSGGVQALPIPIEQCYKLQPARQWQGYWRRGFETSLFCSSPSEDCFLGATKDGVWLSFSEDVPELKISGEQGYYAISFIGRGTRYPGSYGHLGAASHAVILDRVISIREAPDPAR